MTTHKHATEAIERVLTPLRVRLHPDASETPKIHAALAKIEARLAEVAPAAVLVPGGSYAKGTVIRGSHDIDCFVQFPLGTSDAAMSGALVQAFPHGEVLHGSRDYLHVHEAGYVFELVPVLAIRSSADATNIMDMSPLHVTYISEHLTAAQRDDARLAKQFCKAAGIYGAESFIRGFSGYVLELLISIYGSFEALLRASSGWHAPVILDPAKHYRTPHDAVMQLNDAKTESPLILIDPVQRERNAAAALSVHAFTVFKQRASEFIEQPHEKYFDTTVSRDAILKAWHGKHVEFVTVKTPEGKRDRVGSKVRALHDTMIRLLTEHEFPLVFADWRFDEKDCLLWYVLTETTLSETTTRRGPPSTLPDAVAAFRREHPHAAEANGRWFATVKRDFTTVAQVRDVVFAAHHHS